MSYTERLQQFLTANDITNSMKQWATLLSMCGASMYQLIRNLSSPAKSPPDIWWASTTSPNPPAAPAFSHRTTFQLPLLFPASGWNHFTVRGRTEETSRTLRIQRFPQQSTDSNVDYCQNQNCHILKHCRSPRSWKQLVAMPRNWKSQRQLMSYKETDYQSTKLVVHLCHRHVFVVEGSI